MRNKRVHFNNPGHTHELTFSCYRRKPFMHNELFCKYLSEAIVKARETLAFKVWAYVFMPEHVHLLLYPIGENYSMSRILQSIKQSCARRVMIFCKKNDPEQLIQFATGLASKPYRFWQDGGGYDRNLTSRAALVKVIDYIHANPVRRGLVSSPESWYWSSYGDWHSLRESPIRIDKEEIPLT